MVGNFICREYTFNCVAFALVTNLNNIWISQDIDECIKTFLERNWPTAVVVIPFATFHKLVFFAKVADISYWIRTTTSNLKALLHGGLDDAVT
jgi:hypothetical protein